MTNTEALSAAATALVKRYDRMSEAVRVDLRETVPGLLDDLARLAAALDESERPEWRTDGRPANAAARRWLRG